MSAAIQFAFEIKGTGVTQLSVELIDPSPLLLEGHADPAQVRYRVKNHLPREVVIDNIRGDTEGTATAKVTVTPGHTVLTVPAADAGVFGTADSFIDVQTLEAMAEGDNVSVLVSGEEGVT